MTPRPKPSRSLLLAPLAAALAACAPAPGAEAPPPAPPAPPAPTAPSLVTPSRWLVRHVETLVSSASLPLPGGGVLHGSEGGARWMEPPAAAGGSDADAGASGPSPEAATMLLPERVAAIQRAGERWAFFGASGRAYLAASPLGAIDEVRPPPAPSLSVSAGRGAVFMVTRRGDLVRTTDGGAHWTPVRATGASTAVPISAAFRADGAGVVLAAPQRAFVTADDGATWAPLSMPVAGPHAVSQAEDGEIWLTHGYDRRTHRLTGQPPAFVPGKFVERDHKRKGGSPSDDDIHDWSQAIAGRRVVSVAVITNDLPRKIQLSDLDREGEWKDIPELAGCLQVPVVAYGGDFVLGCVLRAGDGGAPAPAAADAGPPAKFRLVLHRSKDGGASWTDDGEVPLWERSAKLVAGPDGWLLVLAACRGAGSACSTLSVRPAAGKPFAPLDTKTAGASSGSTLSAHADDAELAVDPSGRALLAAWTDDEPPAHFQRLPFDGPPGKPVDLPDVARLDTIGVGANGAVTIVAGLKMEGQGPITAPVIFRSTDGGATFEQHPLPGEIKLDRVGLAGSRGLLVDDDRRYWETANGGKDWVPVSGPPPETRLPVVCGADGCATGSQRRLGWDLAAEGAPLPLVAGALDDSPRDRVPGAAPLRCTAGAPRTVPRALAGLDDLAVSGWTGGRFVVPVATKAKGVELAMVTLADEKLPLRTTSFFDAAPNEATLGSQTVVTMSPTGILGSRATYPVDKSGADVWISPVSLEVAWWRPEAGGVERGRIAPSGKGNMRGTFSLQSGRYRDDVFSISPDAVYFRPNLRAEEPTDLYTFARGGRSAKAEHKGFRSARDAVRGPAGVVLLGETSFPEVRATIAFSPGASEPLSWTLGAPGRGATVQPLFRRDGAALVVAWPGPEDGPAHGYVVPLRPGDDPPEFTDLGLAAVLGEQPRACPAALTGAAAKPVPGVARFRIGLPRAVRRLVLVEGGPKPVLLRADSALVVVPPEGPACVSAWLARGPGIRDLAVIPLGALPRSFWVAEGDRHYDSGYGRSDLAVRALRCEEVPAIPIPASFTWKGF